MAQAVRFDDATDPYLIQSIEWERCRRGDRHLTKTARDLIRERLAQLEGASSAPAPASTGSKEG